MEIFFLDAHPKRCATFHTDYHTKIQPIVYAQILSTIVWWTRYKNHKKWFLLRNEKCSEELKEEWRQWSGLYVPTHINHPICQWARESRKNYDYICKLANLLAFEHQFRFGTKHESEPVIRLLFTKKRFPKNLGLYKPLTKFPIGFAIQEDTILTGDPVTDYRINYKTNWMKHKQPPSGKIVLSTWTRRKKPNFMNF